MYCWHCGKELTGDERFCTGCGTPVERQAQREGGAAEPAQGLEAVRASEPERGEEQNQAAAQEPNRAAAPAP